MEKQGLKKVCPLLAIAQAASGQNVQSLAPCIGERCAFCTLSAPVIKCKKTPDKKCRILAERRNK